MATNEAFKSLSGAQDVYSTRNHPEDKRFRATVSTFLNVDSTIVEPKQAGMSYIVKNFVNLVNSCDTINSRLGTNFVDDDQFHNIPANLNIFCQTKEEAEAYVKEMRKGRRVIAPVVVRTHEYKGNTYIDLNLDTPSFFDSNSSSRVPHQAAPATAAAAAPSPAASVDPSAVDPDNDLPM